MPHRRQSARKHALRQSPQIIRLILGPIVGARHVKTAVALRDVEIMPRRHEPRASAIGLLDKIPPLYQRVASHAWRRRTPRDITEDEIIDDLRRKHVPHIPHDMFRSDLGRRGAGAPDEFDVARRVERQGRDAQTPLRQKTSGSNAVDTAAETQYDSLHSSLHRL